MKAAILDGPGGPQAFRLAEVPVPACGQGEVLVQVMACGVGSRDIAERNGTYRRHVAFPMIIGLEIAGTVSAVGPGVRLLQVGDHVASKAFASCGMCRYCRSGRESSCVDRRPVRGGYGEFTALPEDALVKIPPSIAFEAACSLGPAAGVALNAVRDTARVTLAETVLVTGASGGVGLPALQLAHLCGARTIAVTRSPAKSESLRSAGADHVVVMSADGRFADQVLGLTGDDGVDVVIDTVGSPVFWESFRSLALHGRYAVVGQVEGERVQINLAHIFFKRAQLLGVGSVSRAQIADVAALTAGGQLRPRIERVFPLDEVAQAHTLVESGGVTGRVVLMADPSRARAR